MDIMLALVAAAVAIGGGVLVLILFLVRRPPRRHGPESDYDDAPRRRWFKCVLGCQHLLSTCQNGVAIQVYLALIASVPIVQWTGQKPNKRTFEMLCLYFQGWASEQELMAHLRKRVPTSQKP